MPSTSCSAPTFATCACSSAGLTCSRADPRRWKIFRQKTCPRRCSEGSAFIGFGILGRVGLVFGTGGRAGTARQREGFAFIERADAALVEAGFLDLQIGAIQRVRRQLLDREANRFGRGAKTPIGKPGPLLLADRGGKQFGGGVVAEGTHGR